MRKVWKSDNLWSQDLHRFVADCCKETLLMTSLKFFVTDDVRPCEDNRLSCRYWPTRVWRSLPISRSCSCCSAGSARTRRWEAGSNRGTRCCRTWRWSRSSSHHCKHPNNQNFNECSTRQLNNSHCCFQVAVALYSESHLMLSLVNVVIRLMWSKFIVPFTKADTQNRR